MFKKSRSGLVDDIGSEGGDTHALYVPVYNLCRSARRFDGTEPRACRGRANIYFHRNNPEKHSVAVMGWRWWPAHQCFAHWAASLPGPSSFHIVGLGLAQLMTMLGVGLAQLMTMLSEGPWPGLAHHSLI